MRVKGCLFLLAGLLIGACPALSHGAIVQMADSMANLGFDQAFSVGGSTPDFDYGLISASANAWGTTGEGYYIHSYSGVEDTAPNMTYSQCQWIGDEVRTYQEVMTPLVVGDTYQVSLKYRQFVVGADTRASADLYVSWGDYAGGLYDTVYIPASEITAEWKTLNYSFTYAGNSLTPNWAMVLRTVGTIDSWSGVCVDSLGQVPEPATMSLLLAGLVGVCVRRNRK